MSPDAPIVPAVVGRAVRRARLLVAAESAAIGAVVAAWSVPAGLLVAAAAAVWRAPSASRSAVLRTLERADPGARNLLTTADEIASGALVVKPFFRERVHADAAPVAAAIELRRVLPIRRLALFATVAAGAWVVASALDLRRGGASEADRSGAAAGTPVAAVASRMRVTASIEPPAYTRLPGASVADPTELEAIQHSVVRFTIQSASPRVTIDVNGTVHTLGRGADGAFTHAARLTASGYASIVGGDGTRRMVAITVKPDTLPAVRIRAPGRDLVYGGGNPRIAFRAEALDDFGLDALTLRYTKVSGSGEQFDFIEGEIPLTIDRQSVKDWRGSAARTLADLGLAEGDMLVYQAVASDRRPGGGEARSDAYFIEISRLGVAAGDAFTLPEQETRYALSQQMLIVKTERLERRRASMDPAEFAEAAQGLAVEQRMIRSEIVFMLGGEVEDEEIEAEQSVELLAGRLENRGQRDLRTATIAMSQAEKQLTGANTAAALVAERAAVEALQRAFAKDRYILRALATRSQLDPARRLTGAVEQPLGWRRTIADVPENRRLALLQSLLEGLARPEPMQLAVLAELAIRIDPESASMRKLAADLQRLADTWTSLPPDARAQTIDALAAAVAAEARGAMADPPASIGVPR